MRCSVDGTSVVFEGVDGASPCIGGSGSGFRSATSRTLKLLAHLRGEARLGGDKDPGTRLTAEERLSCRKWQAALAAVQFASGTCAGVLVALGAPDV